MPEALQKLYKVYGSLCMRFNLDKDGVDFVRFEAAWPQNVNFPALPFHFHGKSS